MTIGEVCVTKGAAQKPGELDQLAPLLPGHLETVLEIGSAEGGTAWFWHLCGAKRICCLDRRPDTTLTGYPPGVEPFFYMDSHSDNTRAVIFAEVGAVDILFIDGDHSYDGVRQDYFGYRDLVRPGGLVIFHDILHHPGLPDVAVDRLWQELKSDDENVTQEFVCGPLTWGGIGVLDVPGGGSN